MAEKIGELNGYEFYVPTTGGKAGTNCNKTSTIQIRRCNVIVKQIRFVVGEHESRLGAIIKAKKFAMSNAK